LDFGPRSKRGSESGHGVGVLLAKDAPRAAWAPGESGRDHTRTGKRSNNPIAWAQGWTVGARECSGGRRGGAGKKAWGPGNSNEDPDGLPKNPLRGGVSPGREPKRPLYEGPTGRGCRGAGAGFYCCCKARGQSPRTFPKATTRPGFMCIARPRPGGVMRASYRGSREGVLAPRQATPLLLSGLLTEVGMGRVRMGDQGPQPHNPGIPRVERQGWGGIK